MTAPLCVRRNTVLNTTVENRLFAERFAKDDRKLLFPYEVLLKQKTKKIAIFLILSAKLNTKEERK